MSAAEKDDELVQFYKQWKWKREHLPDRERFKRPYKHEMHLNGSDVPTVLQLKQANFVAQGFASTVWDSSIVMSKYLEHHAASLKGKRCLDLSAGCGLVGVVMALLGAGSVVATDLPPNLPLLQQNCQLNAPGKIDVLPYTWGDDAAPLQPPFDIIGWKPCKGCPSNAGFTLDVMYVSEAVGALVTSLRALCHPCTAASLAASFGRDLRAKATTPDSGQAPDPPALASHSLSCCPLSREGIPQAGTPASNRPPSAPKRPASEFQPDAAPGTTKLKQQPGKRLKGTLVEAEQGGCIGRGGLENRRQGNSLVLGQTQERGEGSSTGFVKLKGGGWIQGATEVLVAHGRNRTAEAAFLQEASLYFSINEVPSKEQHPDFHSSDVVVYRLQSK